MPIIQQTLRVQLSRQATPIVRTTSLEVESLEEFTFVVDGVPPPPPAAPQAQPKPGAKPKKTVAKAPKPVKKVQTATITASLSNVKFVAVYDGGEGSGVRVKVGSQKMTSLKDPIILEGTAAAAIQKNPTFVLENESSGKKKIIVLIGSDAKNSTKSQVKSIATK
jgi:hypothetical protein